MQPTGLELDLYSVTTTRGVIMYAVHRENGRSMCSVDENVPYAISTGCVLVVGELAVVQWADGSSFVGGIVTGAPVLQVGAQFGGPE